jgi:hypothetical protein
MIDVQRLRFRAAHGGDHDGPFFTGKFGVTGVRVGVPWCSLARRTIRGTLVQIVFLGGDRGDPLARPQEPKCRLPEPPPAMPEVGFTFEDLDQDDGDRRNRRRVR